MRPDLIIKNLYENAGKTICLYNESFTKENVRSFLRDSFNMTPKINLISSESNGINYADTLQFYFVDKSQTNLKINNDKNGNIVLLSQYYPIITTENKDKIYLYPC
jgi:hypothetical protein